MKFVIGLFTLMLAAQVNAAPLLYCSTEKQETDPEDGWFKLASDTNQDIEMNLVEREIEGRKVLVSEAPLTLTYEFSQSTGGESPWSLTVDEAIVEDRDIKLKITIRRDQLVYFTTVLSMQERNENYDRDMAMTVNELLAVDGNRILYTPIPQAAGERILKNYLSQYNQGLFKKHDLVSLTIGKCDIDR